MNLFSRFPDLYRYTRSEATKARLLAGFLTSNFICFSVFVFMKDLPNRWTAFYHTALWLQISPLLVYGTLRTTGAISQERLERTWDFQRLTPLSSFDITLGKLLGAPVFGYFLFAAMLPWTFLVILASGSIGWADFWATYRLPFAVAFFALNFGLLISAQSFEGRQSKFASSMGAFLGLWAVGQLVSMQAVHIMKKLHPENSSIQQMVSFYSLPMSPESFMILSLVVYGIWAFFGAQWRIGEDLLEKRRFWRFPAFLAFLTWYILGSSIPMGFPIPTISKEITTLTALAYACFFVYAGGFLWVERADYWRRWLRGRKDDPDWLDRTPVWVTGYLSLAVIAACLSLLALLKIQGGWSRLLVLLPLFTGRDLLFLQWCRFTRSRRADTMAVIYICLAYALPPMLLTPLKLTAHLYLYAPIPQDQVGFFQNIISGFLQMLLLGLLTFRKLRSQPQPE